MRFNVSLILIFFAINLSIAQQSDCDSIFILVKQKAINENFEKYEKEYHKILRDCPNNYDTHSEIIKNYEEFYTSIPIMAMLYQNMTQPSIRNASKNFKKINYLSERYLSFGPSGTSVHVPPKFAREWDADYENNMSNLEAGFIVTGAINFSPEHKNLNSAEKMIVRFDKLFLKIDSTRSKYYGFYWEFYVDYFISLYKSEHFKTAIYLSMESSNERDIKKWIKSNQQKVKAFYDWKAKYFIKKN